MIGWIEEVVYARRGRVTLINNTLSNLPAYFISLFPIPVGMECIEKLHKDFLWGGLGEERKFHLVKWAKVCSLVLEGGVG